jgi:AcrR family transcriptional regulator
LEQVQAAELGLRERKKAARRHAIKATARELFYEKGYEGTTTLEIANRVGIAEGTLFLYAGSKQELLLMLTNDDIAEITERAAAKLELDGDLLDQVMVLFSVRYAYWAKHPELSRQSMQTALMHGVAERRTPEYVRYEGARQALLERIVDLVGRQQRLGRLDKGANTADVAAMILAIFLAEVRRWVMAPNPKVRPGVERLRRLLSLALAGCLPPSPANSRTVR